MVVSVSWRRVSAVERLVMLAARSLRRRAVEVSISSRSGSVREGWGVSWVRRWGDFVDR